MNPFKKILCLFLLMVVFESHAANVGFLKYSLISDLTDEDISLLQESYQAALKKNKPGDILDWTNEKTKNGGDITVIKQYKDGENICKRLKFKSRSKTQSATSYFNFCFVENEWKIAN